MVHATASVRLQSLILTALILGPLLAAGQTLTITNGIQTCTALTNTTSFNAVPYFRVSL